MSKSRQNKGGSWGSRSGDIPNDVIWGQERAAGAKKMTILEHFPLENTPKVQQQKIPKRFLNFRLMGSAPDSFCSLWGSCGTILGRIVRVDFAPDFFEIWVSDFPYKNVVKNTCVYDKHFSFFQSPRDPQAQERSLGISRSLSPTRRQSHT